MDKISSFSVLDPRSNMKGFLIFVFALIALGAAGIGLTGGGGEENDATTPVEQAKTPYDSVAPHTLVYGFWSTQQNSEIKSFNMTTGESHTLASLPASVKRVKVMSPTQIMFINNTDDRDHGTELATIPVGGGDIKPIFTAEPDFGIDEYVLSPNGQYAAIWELSISPESSQLLGGRSRVYTVDVFNPARRHLIYDEIATVPVHYPLAITNDGTVYLDTFLPNDNAGWAFGMSRSTFDGSTRTNIQGLENGTYGTQPQQSPDGRYLAFAGYTGGDGATLQNGFRKAILSPNEVRILDLTTGDIRTIPGFPNTNRYPSVSWDTITGNLIITSISSDETQTGQYIYNLQTGLSKKLNLEGFEKERTFIAELANDTTLMGLRDGSEQTLGNLGPLYSAPYSSFTVHASGSLDAVSIPLSEGLVQLIDIKPQTYFAQSVGIASADGTSSPENALNTQDKLQLQMFVLKPTLAPKRLEQQTQQRCRTLAAQICNDMLGTNFSGEERGNTSDSQYNQCWNEQFKAAKRGEGACYDSPLYLYGERGQKISVAVHVPTFGEVPASVNGTYSVTLGDNNEIHYQGKTYPYIDYKYASKKITPPHHGIISTKDKLPKTLSFLGKQLGLSQKEIDDTIRLLTPEISSPYVFISFFDDQTSKEILPLSFEPDPDTYINIVFYAKQLDAFPIHNPPFPQFSPIPTRKGFTAVETSWIIE